MVVIMFFFRTPQSEAHTAKFSKNVKFVFSVYICPCRPVDYVWWLRRQQHTYAGLTLDRESTTRHDVNSDVYIYRIDVPLGGVHKWEICMTSERVVYDEWTSCISSLSWNLLLVDDVDISRVVQFSEHRSTCI